MDTNAFFTLSYGLYVVSSVFDGKQNGCVVNTVTQVTSQPPKLTVAINKQNLTTELIEKSGMFNAVSLTEKATMLMIGRFGFREGAKMEKYADIPFAKDSNGICYPTESVAALFSCKVIDRLDLGTHILFVGEVTEAKRLSDDPVMTYAYYHTVIKGKTPPKASSYIPPAK